MIRVASLKKSYGPVEAVKGVSFDVRAGEIFGLVGPDGAGKTSVLRMLTGLVAPSSGQLSVMGSPDPARVRDRMGYVPQRFSLYGDLTVMENIRLIGALYGQNDRETDRRAEEILRFTKLHPFRERLGDHLSGGMKQKLALAAGLMHQPALFVLDEPTTGVDPVSRREFWRMLYRLNKDGMTVLVSTPYMDEAELCHRVAFMNGGVITRCDSPQRLRAAYPYRILELVTAGRNIRDALAGCPLRDINMFGECFHLVAEDPAEAAACVRAALARAGLPVHGLREIAPSLEDVFVALASEVA